MAKRMKKADAQPSASEITPDDLRRVLKEWAKQAANAAEYLGLAGQAIKTAIERHSLDRRALRVVMNADKMESQKRQAFYRQLMELAHKAGHFDQTDAFDDIVDRLETIASEIRDGGTEPLKQDGVIAHLVQ